MDKHDAENVVEALDRWLRARVIQAEYKIESTNKNLSSAREALVLAIYGTSGCDDDHD